MALGERLGALKRLRNLFVVELRHHLGELGDALLDPCEVVGGELDVAFVGLVVERGDVSTVVPADLSIVGCVCLRAEGDADLLALSHRVCRDGRRLRCGPLLLEPLFVILLLLGEPLVLGVVSPRASHQLAEQAHDASLKALTRVVAKVLCHDMLLSSCVRGP